MDFLKSQSNLKDPVICCDSFPKLTFFMIQCILCHENESC